MSIIKVDLDYNAEHLKNQILLLEAIYKEKLRQEKIEEDEEEQKRRNCIILKRQVKKDEEEESKEIEPVVEPVVEPKKKSDKIICDCGLEVVKRNMKRHCTSKNHIFQLELKKKKENSDLQI